MEVDVWFSANKNMTSIRGESGYYLSLRTEIISDQSCCRSILHVLLLVTDMAVIFQIGKTQSNVWVIDVIWIQFYLVMDNIARPVMARLTNPSINRLTIPYVGSSTPLPSSAVVEYLGKLSCYPNSLLYPHRKRDDRSHLLIVSSLI